MKKEKIPLKTRMIIGTLEALVLAFALGLWGYFKGDELNYWKYIFQAVGFGFLMSWMFKYKIVKEKS